MGKSSCSQGGPAAKVLLWLVGNTVRNNQDVLHDLALQSTSKGFLVLHFRNGGKILSSAS